MQKAPIPKKEEQRLVSLHTLGLLDTSPQERFDLITRTATSIFRVPISTLTLVDSKREWFKSFQGLPQHEGDRAVSFCGHALLSDTILVVPDMKKDSRFSDNPMVRGEPYIRFYAGVPVMSTAGHRVGVFCIKDTKPREFSTEEEEVLKGLAWWAEVEINFRNVRLALSQERKVQTQLRLQTKKLEGIDKSQEEIRRAMLNVMEDLEDAKTVIEIEKIKDEAMLASIGDGLVAVDNNRKIISMNNAAEKMLGWKRKDVMGKEITSLPLEDEEGHLLPLNKRPTHEALSSGKPINQTYFFVRKDKTRFPIAINVTPIRLGGKTVGAIDIFRDITQEKEIDKAKSEFVSLASHQLRTPLGIMKWYLEALENEDYFRKSPIEIRNYYDQIYKSNERVLSLVRDLLSVSRIDQGRIKNVPKSVDLIQIITETVEQMQIVARKKKVTLYVNLKDQQTLPITIDSLRFHEVIENLIGNAVEYTMEEGQVDVGVKKQGDTIFISIQDNGMGISEADQKNLFTKFFRSEKAVKHNPEGSGLGLYLVKSYVEGWGGKVSVESSEGKGSTFTISLPIVSEKRHARGEEGVI